MPYYYTDHNKFYNPFAMFAYAAVHTPNTFPKFDLFDETFDRYDWSTEPSDSFESLLEKRAVQLRCKYDKLVFYFSGGTDSTTIYRIFKKLNIHLDEIIITYDEDDTIGTPAANVKWLKENHYDPTTIITAIDSRTATPQYYETLGDGFLADPDFIYMPSYCSGMAGYRKMRHGDGKFDNYSCAQIVGSEKPHVVCIDGKWYARQLDKIYTGFLDNGRTEYFFVSPDLPELHIKQSHLLKNAAKAYLSPDVKNWESSSFANIGPEHYIVHANWCGRNDDIRPGVSFTQKTFLKQNPIDVIKVLQGKENYISTNDKFSKYLTGFKEFQTDTTIINYMIKFGLLDADKSVDQYYGIHTKIYPLE